MVSRLSVACRHLAVPLLLFCLIFPQAASARNPYTLRDGHEGDPGDGVLNPTPVLDPDPIPKNDLIPIFTFRMIHQGGHHFQPVFIFTGFSNPYHLVHPQTGFQIVMARRWHRAP